MTGSFGIIVSLLFSSSDIPFSLKASFLLVNPLSAYSRQHSSHSARSHSQLCAKVTFCCLESAFAIIRRLPHARSCPAFRNCLAELLRNIRNHTVLRTLRMDAQKIAVTLCGHFVRSLCDLGKALRETLIKCFPCENRWHEVPFFCDLP